MTFENLRDKARSLGTRATAAGVASMALVAPAFAAVDTAAIESEFSEYKTAVVGLVIAFAVVLWAIRGAGLLKPR